ncbi:MAG TPA: hypothetical protein PLB02_05255 [Thermoanaerobaculia bacterium]|nr:hypothetical protein [Thermoanaerobaculia bacterium]HQR66781.1 hypothetical protein [Thermoanaerobaculia bacterium]
MRVVAGSLNPWARLLGGVAAAAVVLSTGSRWAAADESGTCTPAKEAPKKASASAPARQDAAKPAVAAPVEPAGQAGMKAFIDPATGQLREPTPEEAAAAARLTRLVRAGVTAEPKAVVHPNGMVSAELGEEYMNDVVVRKGPDGKLSMACVPHAESPKALDKPAPPAKAELEKE